jgi:hypothetical protein
MLYVPLIWHGFHDCKCAECSAIQVNFNIGNDGDTGFDVYPTIQEIIQASIQFSTDPIISDRDELMAVVPAVALSGGASRSFGIQLQMPADRMTEQHYIDICVSGNASVSEVDRTNICAVAPIIIYPSKTVDLQISDVTLSADKVAPDDLLSLSFRMSNTGNSETPPFPVPPRLSANATIEEKYQIIGRRIIVAAKVAAVKTCRL